MTQFSANTTTSELRLLYFEGPDGAGKTTRIEEIASDYTYRWHNGVYPSLDDSFRAYMDQVRTLENDELATGILDRGILSDLIYGLQCRGEFPPQHRIEQLCNRMNLLGTQLIICLPPYQVCYDNWVERVAQKKEYVTDPKLFGKIYDRYVGLVHNFTLLPVEVYDYTGEYPHVRQKLSE